MHKEVFESKKFTEYAKENLVLFEVDFPRRKKIEPALRESNEALLKQFGVEAFPMTMVLGPEGKKLDEALGYDGKGPDAFIARIEKLKEKQKPRQS